MKQFLFFVFVMLFFCGFAQKDEFDYLREKYNDKYVITDPDASIALDTVVLLPKPKFKTRYDALYYNWFTKKTHKAYPYAVLAKKNLDAINDTIATIKSKRKRKRYIKKKQKFFEEEFAKRIKKLTRTEGRILIKLIHRLTGLTVNEHVQDKRGKFKAFMYRVSASVFKIKLNLEYHPELVMEDYMIETILQKAFVNEVLEEFPSVLESANNEYPVRVIEIKKKK